MSNKLVLGSITVREIVDVLDELSKKLEADDGIDNTHKLLALQGATLLLHIYAQRKENKQGLDTLVEAVDPNNEERKV